MGGFLGVGGSSAKTDRGNQLAATSGEWNLFNYGMGAGQEGQKKGQSDLNTALGTLGGPTDYWKSILAPGRAQATTNAAPATNAVLDQADAARRQEGELGTSRTGGTAAINRESGATATKSIDDIINQSMMGGRDSAAKGLMGVAGQQAGIGSQELYNSLSQLGLSHSAISDILGNATASRPVSQAIHDKSVEDYGQAIGTVLTKLFLGGGN